MVVSDNNGPASSFSGDRLYFRHRAAAWPPSQTEAPDLIKVDIWNYKDAELQPMQEKSARIKG